jgi:hypothetical protein
MIPVQKVFTKVELRAVRKTETRNIVPICKDCHFYSRNGGSCSKFAYMSLVDGNETKVPAIDARTSYEMCGIGGCHFQPKAVQKDDADDDVVDALIDC